VVTAYTLTSTKRNDVTLTEDTDDVETGSIDRVRRGPLSKHDAAQRFVPNVESQGNCCGSKGLGGLVVAGCVSGYTNAWPTSMEECFDKWGHAGHWVTLYQQNVPRSEEIDVERQLVEDLLRRHPELAVAAREMQLKIPCPHIMPGVLSTIVANAIAQMCNRGARPQSSTPQQTRTHAAQPLTPQRP
jgi:hypothetical protein